MLFQDIDLKVSIPENVSVTKPGSATCTVNELQFGSSINRAVEQGNRADFGLILAMFSADIRETTPVEAIEEKAQSEIVLRRQLAVPEPQQLRSEAESYSRAATISDHFHKGGMTAAQLQSDLCPDAMAYLPEHTHNLTEEVYRNLSLHEQRTLATASQKRELMPDNDLYNKLVVAKRTHQIQLCA